MSARRLIRYETVCPCGDRTRWGKDRDAAMRNVVQCRRYSDSSLCIGGARINKTRLVRIVARAD